MKNRFIATVAGAILLACAVNTAANATPVIYTLRAAFDAAAGGLNFESFEAGFSSGSPVGFSNGFSLSETTAGGALWADFGTTNNANTDGTHTAGYSEDVGSIGKLHFATTVNAVGFDITRDISGGTSGKTDVVRIVANAVSTNLTLSDGVPQFYGVIDTMAPISLVTLDASVSGGSTIIDAVSFGPVTAVPEPAALAIFGFGLAGLVVMRRRRRAHGCGGR